MRKIRMLTVATVVTIAMIAWLIYPRLQTWAQNDLFQLLAHGAPVTGNITNRYGEAWIMHGCAGDVLTATIQSNAFAPNLEVYPPVGRTPLAATDNSVQKTEQVANLQLPTAGEYTLVALGSSVRDRGAYSLTLVISDTAALPENVHSFSFDIPMSGTVNNHYGEEWGFRGCAGHVVTLTMHSDVFTPYLELYGPTGRTPLAVSDELSTSDRTDISAFTLSQTGDYTVLAAGQSIRDRGPYTLTLLMTTGSVTATQPLSATIVATPTPVPPTATLTPSPTSTPTQRPTVTPTPMAVDPALPQPEGVLVQGPGGDPGDLAGALYIAPEMLAGYDDNGDPIFRDTFYFELYVFDLAYGTSSGAGIDSVTFNIFCPNGGSYTNIEEDVRYCSFGGGAPRCSALRLAPGAFLPDSDCLIEDGGGYSASIDALPLDDRREGGNWNFDFAIDLTGNQGGNTGGAANFAGNWYTNFAEITFQQSGDRVTGSYQRYGRNEAIPLNGTVSERTLTGNFGNNPADQVTFTLSADGNYLDGAWFYRVDGQWRQWCGTRVGLGALPDGCGFSGDWFTISDYTPDSPPTANLQQTGPRVTGTFFNGSATGTIEGVLGQAGPDPHHSLSGVYSVNGGRGAFRWDLLDFNSNQFAGCWANNEGAHEWCGWRAGGQQPAQCLANIPCP